MSQWIKENPDFHTHRVTDNCRARCTIVTCSRVMSICWRKMFIIFLRACTLNCIRWIRVVQVCYAMLLLGVIKSQKKSNTHKRRVKKAEHISVWRRWMMKMWKCHLRDVKCDECIKVMRTWRKWVFELRNYSMLGRISTCSFDTFNCTSHRHLLHRSSRLTLVRCCNTSEEPSAWESLKEMKNARLWSRQQSRGGKSSKFLSQWWNSTWSTHVSWRSHSPHRQNRIETNNWRAIKRYHELIHETLRHDF